VASHFLRHVEQQAAVGIFDAAEQGTKATEDACIFSAFPQPASSAPFRFRRFGGTAAFSPS
jgi:hypothetical protein